VAGVEEEEAGEVVVLGAEEAEEAEDAEAEDAEAEDDEDGGGACAF